VRGSLFDFVKVDGAAAVALVGTVKKPSVVGAAFSSRGGNPRFVRISISGVSFHKLSSVCFLRFSVHRLFSRKISRQDTLGTTLAVSVDL
jgi:hypothetical protein